MSESNVWDELVGQPGAVAQLQRAVRDPASMTHAWLLTGPPGSGRSNAALAFAAALECPNGGCGTCASCRSIAAGTHPDVTVMRTNKVTITIDEVRELVSKAGRTTVSGPWRIMMIEDADRMLERTTNVLLKAIEEPAPHTVWILCAPSPLDVLVTIRSRCRQVGLRVPAPEAVADLIVKRDGIDRETALTAARAAQSHIGRARRFAREPQILAQRNAVLEEVLRLSDVTGAVATAGRIIAAVKAEAGAVADQVESKERAHLLATLGALDLKTLPPAVRAQVRQLEDDQKRRRKRRETDTIDQMLTDISGALRDVLVAQLSAEVPAINEKLEDAILACANRTEPSHVVAAIDAVRTARLRIEGNVAPILAVEAMLIAIAMPAVSHLAAGPQGAG
ncbi:DNA polymerase III subunit delta' [Rarobacter incanus]|uniref:DNA polymerase III subunit delta' n=1 Tax=Rarobacter incanus TaxID=153494 RepID=UPI001FE50B58|nr:DNA polymerase III subunit delta' [Rarobacter incanus]